MLRILVTTLIIPLTSHADVAMIVDLNKPDTYRALFDSGIRLRKAFREEIDGLLEIRPAKKSAFKLVKNMFQPLKQFGLLILPTTSRLMSSVGLSTRLGQRPRRLKKRGRLKLLWEGMSRHSSNGSIPIQARQKLETCGGAGGAVPMEPAA